MGERSGRGEKGERDGGREGEVMKGKGEVIEGEGTGGEVMDGREK